MELTTRIKQRLREVQDWNAVIDELEAEANASGDPATQSKAFFELARTCEDVFLDKARAMQCYQRAFKLDQSNLVALERARLIYQQMAHLEMVTRLMGLELRNNQDPARAPALNHAYGRAMLNLRQVDTARGFLEAAASAQPQEDEYQARFQETLYDRNNWQFALQTVYDQLIALTGNDDPLAADVPKRGAQLGGLYLRAARILQQESPEDPKLLPLLFKALDANPLNTEAAFIAETMLAVGGHLQHIQKLQDRRASLIDDDERRIALLRDFAITWQVRLNNSEMAAYFYRQALELAYRTGTLSVDEVGSDWHLAAYRAVKLQAEHTGNADGLIPLAERALSVLQSDIDSSLIALQAGEIAWRQFGDIETARKLFERAAPSAPKHPIIVEFTKNVGPLTVPAGLPEQGKPEPQPEREAKKAESSKPERTKRQPEVPAVSSAVEAPTARDTEPVKAEPAKAEPAAPIEPISMGDEEFTGDEARLIDQAQKAESKGPARAIDAWRDVVTKLPTKRYPRARLKQLYAETSKWSNVADLLKDELKHVTEDDITRRQQVLWELVEVYRDQLKQPGLVVTTLASLEKTFEVAGDSEALLRVIEAQQEQFDQMKRWPDLIGRLRRRAELTQDGRQRTELNLEAGRLFLDKFNNQAEAIKSFEAVLETDSYNAEAIAKLKDLYGRRRDWEKMVTIQQRELTLIEDPTERKAQLLEVARTAGTKIKKSSLSIELWNQLLEIDPDNVEALEQLEHLEEREKDWKSLARTLGRLAQVAGDAAKKGQYLVKLGLLYAEKLDDNKAAIAAWERLYEFEPENRRAQDALKKLYLAEGDMGSLEGFFAKQDKWGEFIRVLERESETAEGQNRVTLLVKIAELYRKRLDKPDKAMRSLEKALSYDEDNLDIAEGLLELYRQANDERNMPRPLGIKLAHTQDPSQRQELLRQLADLAERVQGDAALAFDCYRRAFAEDHQADDLREHLKRLAVTTAQCEQLVEALEQAIAKFGSTRASLPLRLELAMVYETRLSQPDAALKANQTVLDIDAEEPTALASLERLFLALGRAEDLLGVLDRKLSLANSDDDRRTIQARIGSIHEQLGHHDEAISAYEGVLHTGVEDPTVLAALDRMYEQLERHIDLADVIRRRLMVLPSNDYGARAKLLLRLGVLSQEQLASPRDAVDLFKQVLDLQPDEVEARRRLEALLDDPDLRTDIATILLPVYERIEAWPQMVTCLEIQAEAESITAARVQILLRIGAILAQAMGDSARAFEAYSRAFRDDPEHETAQMALENIAAIEDRWSDFARLFEDAVTKDLPSELMQRLLIRLASLYDNQLADGARAIACYQRAVDIDPEDQSALEALEKLYRRDENWAELLEVYRRKVALEQDPNQREALRFQIAYLQEEMLAQPEQAIATYTEILADDDTNVRAMTALERLYQQRGNWAELAENLQRQLALVDTAQQQIDLGLRLGGVRVGKLDQPELAVEMFHRVLQLDANNPKALAALEKLLEYKDQQLSIARILEPIYRGRNDWAKLVNAYDIMVVHSLDPSEKVRLLHQIGELYEIAGDEPGKAFAAYGRALKEDPSNSDTQNRLEHLARQMGAYAELVALYEEAIREVVDDQLRMDILARVAQLYETALGDANNAAAAYESMLAIDPANFEAVDALIEIHRRANSFEALVNAVVRKAEMVESPEDKKQLLLYAANVRETVMDNPKKSIELYQQVLTIDDTDRNALDALERLYIQLERWEQLKDVYTRKTELAQDPEERRKVLYVLGQVYDAELHDVDRAIDTYQAILDIDLNDQQAIFALDRLYGQAGRWLDQLQILERAVDAAQHREEQTSIRHRIGALWETQLADTVRAIESYRDVLTYDPNHQPTIAALDRIAHGDSEPMLAAQVLEPLYQQLQDWEKLVDLYEVIVRNAEDPQAQIDRMHGIASIYERQLGEFDKAFDAYARALTIDPTHDKTILQLDRVAGLTGEWERFAQLLAGQADNIADPLVKNEMLLRLARIREEKLQDVDRAIVRYLEVLEVDPENLEAIQALDRIFTRLERWTDLVENLRRKVRTINDESDIVALQFRMGQIYQLNMGDVAHAIEAYREILSIRPDHTPTLESLEVIFAEGERQAEIAEILEPIYYTAERWDALVKLGEIKLGATDGVVSRLAIIQNVAEICERRLADAGQAYLWWLRAYMDDPRNDQVSEEMERLADLTQEWGYIVDVGDQILEAGVSPDVRLAVLARSARILDERLRDTPRAIEMYRRVLEIDPENGAALAALDRIYTHAGVWQDLAEVLHRRIRVTSDSDTLMDLEMRLAEVFERYLASPEQAVAAYNRALEHDRRNQQALMRLEALYLGQYQWQALFDVYQRRVDVASTDDAMADCYQRMAKIASDALGRESDAIDLWVRVLDLRGEDPIALGELAGLHERAERWDDLVEVLERQVYAMNDPAEKIAAYQMLGRTYGERLGKHRNALDAWLNALELDPTNVATLEALHQIYQQSQAWVELIDVLQRLIAVGPELLGEDRTRDLYAQMARIHGEYLMQSDEAIDGWLKVLEIRDGDMEALASLEQLYTQEGRWNEAIQALERKSRAVEDTESRIDVLMQIASIWQDKLDDRVQGSAAYLEVLELDPSNLGAGQALEDIYRETEDWAALAELLISRAEIIEDKPQKVETLQGAAKVFEEHLGDLDSAFAVLQAAFNVDYGNERTSRELERLATQAGKWGDLINEYNGLVNQIEDINERCELWVKIGRWYGEHLDRPDYGIQSLERALELNPESVNALRELASFHRRSGNADALAQTLARIVPLEQDPEIQAGTLLDLASAQESALRDVPAAIESYRRVLEIDSESSVALDALARLHETLGQWEELVTVLSRRAATMNDPDEVVALKKRIGRVQEVSLGDQVSAIETYKDILTNEPTDRDALQALERLYMENNSVASYLEILEAELDATADADEQITIYEKMARALVDLAADKNRAAEVLEKIVVLDPQREETYRQLEQLYFELERWTELVETYRSHIAASYDPQPKITLLSAMGEIYEKYVEDIDQAIETYREILQIDQLNLEAALTLSRLQETIEDWPAAIDTMGTLAQLTTDPWAKVELLTRMGRVLLQKLGDPVQAEVRLSEALEINVEHVPALVVLAELYKARRDWLKAARTLESGSAASANLLEKTSLSGEAGFIYLEELDNRAKAEEMFARTMELDPEHARVGRVLSQMYYDGERFDLADPIFDMLVRKVDVLDIDDDEQRDLYVRGAKTARVLGNIDKALKHYKRAYDVDSTNHDVLVGMADLLFEKEDWDRAFKLYQTILVQHRDTQSSEDTVSVYYRLGTIKNREGQPRKALNYFEKALEVEPNHRQTLYAINELQTVAGDWEGVIQAKRALIDCAVDDADEQFQLYKDIGDLYLEKLQNRDKAAAAYQSALELKPEDYPMLHTLLDLYTQGKKWEDAIRLIDRIVEIEKDPIRRSRYNYTAAVLLRDELNAHDESIDRFNMVLDDDPAMLKAFQALDTMVTKTKDWKTLERSYRKMLKRLPQDGQDELKLTLWGNLGEIYRTRLQDYKASAAAFEVAAKLEPSNVDRHIILAELYERLMQDDVEYVDAAVREHQILIASEPFRYESYHALYNIYRNSSQVDKAFCVASVLVFLKKASDEQNALFNEYKRQEFQQARQRLSEETLRKHVFHPDQDRYLTGILGLVAPAIAAWRAGELPSSIKAKERVDIAADPSLFSRIAKYVKEVLNVAQPDAYLRPNEQGELAILNIKRDNAVHPSIVVFQSLLKGKAEKHLAFALGRYMLDLYPPHYAFVALDRSHQNLKQIFMACLRICGMPVQGEIQAIDAIAREITARMQPAAVDQLRSLMKRFIEAGGSTDVKKWAAASELTGYRVGFLLCGDLVVAAQMISQEQSVLGSTMSPKDKIKELVLFGISEDFFTARKAIGLQVA